MLRIFNFYPVEESCNSAAALGKNIQYNFKMFLSNERLIN